MFITFLTYYILSHYVVYFVFFQHHVFKLKDEQVSPKPFSVLSTHSFHYALCSFILSVQAAEISPSGAR